MLITHAVGCAKATRYEMATPKPCSHRFVQSSNRRSPAAPAGVWYQSDSILHDAQNVAAPLLHGKEGHHRPAPAHMAILQSDAFECLLQYKRNFPLACRIDVPACRWRCRKCTVCSWARWWRSERELKLSSLGTLGKQVLHFVD